MRKVLLQVAVSLDGFIEGPAGEIDWCFADQDYGMKDFLQQVDALFMGRKTYELMLRMQGGTGFPGITEYVFSNTLKNIKNGGILINGNPEREILKIKKTEGKNIWLFGGSDLITYFMNHRLVDEVWLAVHPVILGGGKPLFQNISGRLSLKLKDAVSYSTGLVMMKYNEVHL